jgi:hypothetical protein
MGIGKGRRHAIYNRDGWRCRYCGKQLRPARGHPAHDSYAPTLDHVMPKSRGGSGDSANLVTACDACGTLKGARTPEEAGMPLLPPGTLRVPMLPGHAELTPRTGPVYGPPHRAVPLTWSGSARTRT